MPTCEDQLSLLGHKIQETSERLITVASNVV